MNVTHLLSKFINMLLVVWLVHQLYIRLPLILGFKKKKKKKKVHSPLDALKCVPKLYAKLMAW